MTLGKGHCFSQLSQCLKEDRFKLAQDFSRRVAGSKDRSIMADECGGARRESGLERAPERNGLGTDTLSSVTPTDPHRHTHKCFAELLGSSYSRQADKQDWQSQLWVKIFLCLSIIIIRSLHSQWNKIDWKSCHCMFKSKVPKMIVTFYPREPISLNVLVTVLQENRTNRKYV